MQPLGDLVSIFGGGTPSRSRPDFYNGPIPWITSKDMKRWDIHTSQERITQAGLDESATRLIPVGSILVVIRSGILKHTLPIAIVRRPVAINQDLKALVPKEDVDPEYLARYIQSKARTVLQWVRATTADNFPLDELKALKVPIPAIWEQRRIAKIFAKADQLRRSCRYTVELGDEFLTAAFLEMFGDPVRNTKGWDIQLVSEIGEVQGGLQQIARREELPLKKPFLRVANVQRGELNLSDIRRIGLTESEFRRTKLQKGDLLLVEGNGNPSEVGRAGMWDGSIDDCVHQNHLIRIRCDRACVLPTFLLSQLNSSRGMAYYLKHGRTTSGLVTISTGLVNEFPALVPPLDLQRQFEQVVARHTLLQCSNVEALRQAEHLFQTLLHQAFTP
jgi:type I restriction enzyme S subunit